MGGEKLSPRIVVEAIKIKDERNVRLYVGDAENLVGKRPHTRVSLPELCLNIDVNTHRLVTVNLSPSSLERLHFKEGETLKTLFPYPPSLTVITMNLHSHLRSSPSSILHFQTITLLSCKTIVTMPSSRRRFTFLRRRHYGPNLKVVVRNSMQEKEIKFLEAEEAELLMATCITRTLPPALTLDLGLEIIKDAVEELKSKPCCSKAGMYRFQIAVSPGSRALSLFCSQDPSLGVFPQFFVSTGVEKPTTKFLSFSRTRGIFGIGAAVYIKSPFCSASTEQIPFRRYQSIDSARLMAYGLFGHTSDKFENRSFYMFIPLIELVESDGLSILTATLAWDDSSLCLYEDAFDAIIYLTTALQGPLQRNA
ncbi:hypothetical protein L6452_20869 [Arctium lappa]|uniref:Uncharacterized protein n=1 Tax=Arctium lappa TaxID=4217 RepID=A0ACB9BDE3_ARCLA|nr:hypothetical protein L6452_20869 [Arctium lappa]